MSLFKKFLANARTGIRDNCDMRVDADSIRQLEDELGAIGEQLKQARKELAATQEREAAERAKVADAEVEITALERETTYALDRGDETLAQGIAERIADIEEVVAEAIRQRNAVLLQAENLRERIKRDERELTEFNRQMLMLRTTDCVQKITSAINDMLAADSARVFSATESLERIRKKQHEAAERLKAAGAKEEEFQANRLRAESVNAVLERIRAKRDA